MAVFVGGAANLPVKVNFVEFLQSSGTQYIDTGFTPNQNTRVVCDFSFVSASGWRSIFGAWEYSSGYKNAFVVQATSSNYFASYYGNANINTSSAGLKVTAGTRYVIDKNKNVCSFNGTVITNAAATFTAPCSLWVFATNKTGATEDIASSKLYSMQIYDNDVLVRDYWPCYDPDGVACLYDKVNKEYVYNAGTGEFIAGEAA